MKTESENLLQTENYLLAKQILRAKTESKKLVIVIQ